MDSFDDQRHQHALVYGIGILSGIFIHHGVFIAGEWHVQAPQIVMLHSPLYVFCPIIASIFQSSALDKVFKTLQNWSYGYLLGLASSILLYRSLFHPLVKNGFPGPWYARITKLWHVWACRHSKNHLVLDALRAKYGSFVRTGPAEVTVFHPDVFMAVDGPRSECLKSEWYDILHPSLALVTTRDKSVHAERRREWNRGFTTKALAEHEAKVLKYVEQLDQCIESDVKARRASDTRNLFLWFGFDVMGDLVFSKPFDMLQNQKWHHIIVRLQRALSLLGPFSPAPWLVQIVFKLAPRVGVLKDWFDTVDWCKTQMRNRILNGSSNQSLDLAHFLMEKNSHALENDQWFWLEGDSLLAIVAGSEPTAVALIAVFCELSQHLHHAEKIYGELMDVDVTDLKALASLPHLNAVIKEALRLHPALLTGGNRKTNANGVTIGGRFIPPHTTIVAPRFSIGRSEDCFEHAKDFIPERWSTHPEMVRNAAAYAPFGTGHNSCLGRTFAIDTMRYVIARLVKKYRFCHTPGEKSVSAMRDVKDQFTSNPGELRLLFELRAECRK